MSDVPSDPTRAGNNERAPYVAPRIEWEEVIEEAGVFAACAKSEQEGSGGCQTAPNAPSPS